MDTLRPEIEPFQILRRWTLYAATAIITLVVALVVAVTASLRGPGWLWGLAALLFIAGLVALPGIADRDTPLLVADDHGVRLRDRAEWVGLLWSEISEIVVEPRAGLQEPRVKVVTADHRRVFSTPVGFTTDASSAEAEVQLARRRAANAY